jgi:molybdopterin-biosynthesis enzyme MoeA-like protein
MNQTNNVNNANNANNASSASSTTTRRRFGLYIVGDEILSGKRQDQHFEKARSIFGARGLSLSWVYYLGDDRDHCIRALKESFASGDVVISCGGIGSTPDDHTRQAAAAALGLPLVLHPQAAALIRERAAQTQQEATPERLQMGEFPEGAQIIPNPYNKIAGFSIREHYFLPGFPVMAWPMMEWVLETFYQDQFRRVAEFDQSMIVQQLFEAAVTPLMQSLSAQYPELKIYSLPSAGENGLPRHLELGVKAAADHAEQSEPPPAMRAAYATFKSGVLALGGLIAQERQAVR